MNKLTIFISVIALIALVSTASQTVQSQPRVVKPDIADDFTVGGGVDDFTVGGGVDDFVRLIDERKAPPAITGDNVYLAWWTNETGNEEVMFRSSTNGGASFGDKINLSNTTNADSTRVELDSDADSVGVTWWETNQTDDTPVMRISNDNGATFGPLLTLTTNGTLGESADEEDEE